MNHTTQQIAAEEVRSHLVLMRGGAPFLSPSDAFLLDSWLAEGVLVSSILTAIESASEARRKRRSRTPLTLRQAKRHLKKTKEKCEQVANFSTKKTITHPLAKLALKLRSTGRSSNATMELDVLADALEGLRASTNDQIVRDALQLFREFFQHVWDQLPAKQREEEIAQAAEELLGVAAHMKESSLASIIEEVARDRLRQQYPLLCSSVLWDTLQAQPNESV